MRCTEIGIVALLRIADQYDRRRDDRQGHGADQRPLAVAGVVRKADLDQDLLPLFGSSECVGACIRADVRLEPCWAGRLGRRCRWWIGKVTALTSGPSVAGVVRKADLDQDLLPLFGSSECVGACIRADVRLEGGTVGGVAFPLVVERVGQAVWVGDIGGGGGQGLTRL